jgi:hypothetical protein
MVAAGGIAQAAPQRSIFDQLIKRIGKRLSVANRHEKPVAFVSNDFGNRTKRCCDHSYTVSEGLDYSHWESFDKRWQRKHSGPLKQRGAF